MPKAGSLKPEDIEKLRATLSNEDTLPQKRDLTKIEAVTQLLPQIQLLRSKGYRLGDVAKALTAGGLPINEATLNSTLTVIKQRAKAKEKDVEKEQKKGRKPAEVRTSATVPSAPVSARRGVDVQPQVKRLQSDQRPGSSSSTEATAKAGTSGHESPKAGPETNKGVFKPVADSEVI
ncbi:hypothetical protein OWM54_43050 [Myxococcus sp. MISCRS1]|uniref:hypothetical protein n=1 Tax=Myxococcus sp. MISCRS1 TaxID=2996786 RepID=UPI00227177A4|nr:hypothetical protein [Myxococcus sp. MISCRS1]MCY1003944.1 hypothetical protein [Myxococcus sp. MISCRS1]